MRAKATPEAVFSACDQLAAAGTEPTVALLVDAVGGSRSTISPLLNQWRDQRNAAAQPVDQPAAGQAERRQEVQQPQPLPRLAAAIEALTTAALADLNEAIESEKIKSAQAISAANDAADRRVKAAEDAVKQVEANAAEKIAAARREVEEIGAEADRLEEERDQAQRDLNGALDANEALRLEIEDWKTKHRVVEADVKRYREWWTQGRDAAEDGQRRAAVAEAISTGLREQVALMLTTIERLTGQRPVLPPVTVPEPAVEAVEKPMTAESTDQADQAEDAGEQPRQRRRPWTAEDDAALRAIAERGGTQADAVRELSRPDGIVSEKWRALGLPVPPRKGRSLKRREADQADEDKGPPLPFE